MQIPPERLAVSSLLGDVEVQVGPVAAAPDRLEPVRKRGEIRLAAKARPTSSRCASAAWPRRPARSSRSPIAGPASRSQHRERIFEPFFTGNEGGTGLGLFLARELAQTNGATFCMSRARAAAACSASCSAIRDAGRHEPQLRIRQWRHLSYWSSTTSPIWSSS